MRWYVLRLVTANKEESDLLCTQWSLLRFRTRDLLKGLEIVVLITDHVFAEKELVERSQYGIFVLLFLT